MSTRFQREGKIVRGGHLNPPRDEDEGNLTMRLRRSCGVKRGNITHSRWVFVAQCWFPRVIESRGEVSRFLDDHWTDTWQTTWTGHQCVQGPGYNV